jgi:hypothetical protein
VKTQESKIFGRVLLVARDELALSQLKDLLLHGSKYVMDRRFRWLITQQSAEIYRKQSNVQKEQHATRLQKHSGGQAKRLGPATETHIASTVGEMDWNDHVIQKLLQESALPGAGAGVDEAQSSSSSSLNITGQAESSHGYMNLGLQEPQVKSLSEEQQLLLLQVRLMSFWSIVSSLVLPV